MTCVISVSGGFYIGSLEVGFGGKYGDTLLLSFESGLKGFLGGVLKVVFMIGNNSQIAYKTELAKHYFASKMRA